MDTSIRFQKIQDTLEAVRKLAEKRHAGRPPVIASVSPWASRKIQVTPDLERIAAIPRRQWEPLGEELARELTPLLRTTKGSQLLFPVQAYTLHELYFCGGAIGIIRVGGGKSLIAFLAPYIVRAFRPLLVVPGGLLEKTRLHMAKDRFDWEIPNFIRVESYEKLGHPDNQMLLYDYKPDLVMLDEGSKCKNTEAVVTKAVGYYVKDCRRGFMRAMSEEGGKKKIIKIPLDVKPKMLVLSGTLTNQSVKDYWHILKWVLEPHMVPLPHRYSELEQWSLCLDVGIGALHRVKPGALLEFCNDEEKLLIPDNPLKAARRAYRRRLLDTPGIVSTQSPFLGASLRLSAAECKPPPEIHEAIRQVRKWKMPDGVEIQDAPIASKAVKELALGFFYRPKPRPPEDYVEAQKEWARACRFVISRNKRRINSEGQVIKAIREEGLYQELVELLDEWEHWRSTFKYKNEAVWISDYAVKFAAAWMKKRENRRGIVWTDRTAFGIRLSEETGISYYGSQSLDVNGRYIENHPHNTPMIASVKANYEGKNLQYGWSKNLLMACISSGEMQEQLLGRSHRYGQPEDEVTAEYFLAVLEHARAFWSAVEDAEFAEDMESARKLMQAAQFADITFPQLEKIETRNGVLWKEGEL